MKKSGFTLIELLAVIVILAIIALIAVPIVLNIIDNSKKESNARSVELYVKAAETAALRYQMDHPDYNADKVYNIMKNGDLCDGTLNEAKTECSGENHVEINVEVEGAIVTGGTLSFIKNENEEFNVTGSSLTLQGVPETTKYKYENGKVTIDDTPAQPTTKTVYRLSITSKSIGDTLTSSDYTTDSSTLNKNNYLKHILDSEDKITNSYVCVKFNGTTERCLEGGPNDTYGWVTTKTDSTSRVAKLYEIEQENISNVSCYFLSSNSYCYAGSVSLDATSDGSVYASGVNADCYVDGDGSSDCESY